MSRTTPELLKVRKAISLTNEEEYRTFITGDIPVQQIIRRLWARTGGGFCARCVHFSPLGVKGSGLCGTCSKVPRSDYTKPEDTCENFESVLEEAKLNHGKKD
ncbi:MAG: hypothetical protein U9N57_01350 [Pseudomonadota bacterium]|nr:hypothetical protein [Pseudomonadota bacterium]